ncbi:MAG: ROK family transcriptional regulator [Trebonia sp.]
MRDLLTARSAKEENRVHLLRTIMARPGSQAYLSNRSGLSPGTVSAAVTELEQRGYVRTTKTGSKSLVTLPQTRGAAVGIELGFHYTAVVARRVEQSIDEARTQVRQVGAAYGKNRWLPDMAEAVRDAVADLGEEEIVAIALGVPRVVDPRSGTLLPPYLPPWGYGDDPALLLAEELRKYDGTPRLAAPRVLLDNDANLAAFAESIYRYDEIDTLIAIKASTGIGAGIIVGGRILRGARGVAGEIGHTVIDANGPFCPCGGRGCLEAFIGADALVEQARSTLAHKRIESPKDLEELIQYAKNGNLTCQRVIREAADQLGFALGSLCNVLNPEVIVLGGAYGRAEAVEFTLPTCREAIRRSAMHAAVGDGRASEVGSRADQALRVEASTLVHAAAHGAFVVAVQGTDYGAADPA